MGSRSSSARAISRCASDATLTPYPMIRLRSHPSTQQTPCWSPQQISRRLLVEFPDDVSMQPLLGNPRGCVSEAPARNHPHPSGHVIPSRSGNVSRVHDARAGLSWRHVSVTIHVSHVR